MAHPLPPLWPPQTGEIWRTTTSPQTTGETTFWLAFREDTALDAITGATHTHLMMINGWGDILTPDDLLAEWRQTNTWPTLAAGPRATADTPPVDSAESREHGATRLLATLGPIGGHRD